MNGWRCINCQKWLPLAWRQNNVQWCGVSCLDIFIEKKGLRQLDLFRKKSKRRSPQQELELCSPQE